MAIIADLKDPRIRDVTVTHVEVTPDMRQAKVHVSIMGDETKQQLGLRGLKNAAGFLQSRIADRIDTRYTPKIEFFLDLGVKKSIEIAQILHDVLPRDQAQANQDMQQPDDEVEADDDADGFEPAAENSDSPDRR